MAVRFRFQRDVAGIGEVLKSEAVAKVVAEAADEIAKNVEDQKIQVGGLGQSGRMDLPVEVTQQITDRARSNVTVAHPAGLAVQAKYGALTKAASQAGLEVHAKGGK